MKANQSLSPEFTLFIFRNSSYFQEIINLIIRYSKTDQKTSKQNHLSIMNLRCKFSEIHRTFQIINLIIRHSKADQKTSKQNHPSIMNLHCIYSANLLFRNTCIVLSRSYFQVQSEDKKSQTIALKDRNVLILGKNFMGLVGPRACIGNLDLRVQSFL